MLPLMAVSQMLRECADQPLEILRRCDGYYVCPKDADNNRLGPLVGYAGRYGKDKKQFVGDVYADYSAIEPYPLIVQHFAKQLSEPDPEALRNVRVYCGAPEGGKSLANMLALERHGRYCYPEKKVTKLATADSREESILVWKRHAGKIESGDQVAMIEDVTNNFSTAAAMINLIEEAGGQVVAIVSLLNRSIDEVTVYDPDGANLPVLSLVRTPILQYEQEDDAVARDIANGNVVWKPKDNRAKLKAAMQNAK